jgi:LysR family transcriptional activator of nhaA
MNAPLSWLNYHHLYYFHAIAKEGSVARAAAKLRLGQPTLSAQLKLLEESLGKPLFDREARGMKLTETGRMVFEYAKEIFRLGNEMTEAVKDRVKPGRVHLQIGALDSVPKGYVQALVAQALKIGNCYVTVLEGSREVLLRELQANRVDLVLTNSPAPIAPKSQVQSRRVKELRVFACGARQFAACKRGFPKSLHGAPVILPTYHSQLRGDLERYFDKNGIEPMLLAETQDSTVQRHLAESGLGIILASEATVRDLLEEKKIQKIGEISGVTEQIWLTSASRFLENPISSRIMETYRI